MPRKPTRLSTASPGALTALCPGPCGHRAVPAPNCACGPCFRSVPLPLRNAWQASADDGGPALEKAAQAIRDYLKAKRGASP